MGSDDRWTVEHSHEVYLQLAECIEVARRAGRLAPFGEASRWILSELQRTPLEFGESRGEAPYGSLLFRCGYVGRLSVSYAVHPESRTVFLRRFYWKA